MRNIIDYKPYCVVDKKGNRKWYKFRYNAFRWANKIYERDGEVRIFKDGLPYYNKVLLGGVNKI